MKQAQKNLVTLLVLTAAAAGLGLYAWYGVKEPGEREEERLQASEQLFAAHAAGEKADDGGAPPAAVFTRLTVKAKGGTTELVKDPDGWRLTAPVAARADAPAVDALVQQLTTAKFKTTVDESPTDADLQKYGLTSPTFTVEAHAYVPDAQGGGAEDPARQRTVTLHGGIENTFDGSVYVRRDGDPKVYAAEGSVRWTLDKSTFDLRAKQFMGPLKEPSFQRIEVKAKAHAYTLERDADGTSWKLVKPVATHADEVRVADLLSALEGQQAQAFPDDGAEARKKLGLESPAVDARFTPKAGEPVRVRMSQVTEGGAAKVYLLREQGAQATLAEVGADALDVLDVDTPGLKDKRVLAFRREDVRRVVFHPGGGAAPITLARTGGPNGGGESWQVEGATPGKAQYFKVLSLVGALDTLKASAFGDAQVKRWEKYGIGEKSRGAVLQGADGKELARLWLGSEVPGKQGTLYARGSGPDVLEVPASAVAELPSRVEDVLEPPPGATDGGTPTATPAP